MLIQWHKIYYCLIIRENEAKSKNMLLYREKFDSAPYHRQSHIGQNTKMAVVMSVGVRITSFVHFVL